MASGDIIAWLVPAANSPHSHKALRLPHNQPLVADLPESSTRWLSPLQQGDGKSCAALRLLFSADRKHQGQITLGTDAETCDVLLPRLPGNRISPSHCSISFDDEYRLTLTDHSDHGTQVWYDWHSRGDLKQHTWLLSSTDGSVSLGVNREGCETTVRDAQRLLVDIQGVRFRIVINTEQHEADASTYRGKVDAFRQCPSEFPRQDMIIPWRGHSSDRLGNYKDTPCSFQDTPCIDPMVLSFLQLPIWKELHVRGVGDQTVDGLYLWNVMRPWEALVRACA